MNDFKIGDKVKIVRPSNRTLNYGDTGIVIKIDKLDKSRSYDCKTSYGLSIDSKKFNGHSGISKNGLNKDWWVYEEEIVLYDEKIKEVKIKRPDRFNINLRDN